MTQETTKRPEVQTKTVDIRNGAGVKTGEITLYWSDTCGWVSVPRNEAQATGRAN